MAKRNKKSVNQAETDELEYVNAEKVETEYHIGPDGKIEQTADEKKRMYKESLIRTAVATIFGIVCGIAGYLLLGGATPEETRLPWFIVLMLILIFTYYLQRRLIFPMLKIDMKLLDWKSWFGIEFLVLVYCIVTWTILLNTSIL